MMPVIAERRGTPRISSTHPAIIRDADGDLLAKGRTANISVSGVFILVALDDPPALNDQLLVELKLPGSPRRHGRPTSRTVHYTARVVRVRPVGQMTGLGMELMDKLG
ncbi:MAG: PilZ domain-containing protein [Planctomycetota bacterium]|jgi:hypothetical protein